MTHWEPNARELRKQARRAREVAGKSDDALTTARRALWLAQTTSVLALATLGLVLLDLILNANTTMWK